MFIHLYICIPLCIYINIQTSPGTLMSPQLHAQLIELADKHQIYILSGVCDKADYTHSQTPTYMYLSISMWMYINVYVNIWTCWHSLNLLRFRCVTQLIALIQKLLHTCIYQSICEFKYTYICKYMNVLIDTKFISCRLPQIRIDKIIGLFCKRDL